MDRKFVLAHIAGRDTAVQLEKDIRLHRKKILRGEDCDPHLHVMVEWYKVPRVKLLAHEVWNERVVTYPTFGHLREIPLEPLKYMATYVCLAVDSYIERIDTVWSR